MTGQLQRRWFRFGFSLRTLFVAITVLGVWLGWQRHLVQERHRLLEWNREHDGSDTVEREVIHGPHTVVRNCLQDDIPLAYKFFSEERYTIITIQRAWEEQPELKQIDAAFPEAIIVVADPY